MKQELDERLVKSFPLLYSDREGDMRSTLMCWGFTCGDGWFQIIWDLSEKIEAIIEQYVKDNPDLECSHCNHIKSKHFGSATKNPGKCLAIFADPFSKEEPPGNYLSCFCDSYKASYPRAAQVKEKYGGLRFYMTSINNEIESLIADATELSYKTCESCGKPGKVRKGSWIRTECDECHKSRG